MELKLSHALLAVSTAILLSAAPLISQQLPRLNNTDIVKVVKGGMADSAITSAIAASHTQFDLSSSGLQTLSQAGVSSKVIRAMLAANAKENSAPTSAQDSAPTQNASANESSGTNVEGIMPPAVSGMSQDSMAQMMANLPPEARARLQAAMAKRNASGGRPGMGGPATRLIPAHAGVPVPVDSALYTSFERLQAQGKYRMIMNLQTNDPRFAQMLAQGTFSPSELIVQGDTRQYVMYYKVPATDVPGTVDDWEIRAIVQNGRAASLITSPAVPRLLKLSEERAAQQMAQLDRMAANAIARAAASGPMGALGAGMTAAQVALMHVEVPRMVKRQKEVFSWKCRDAPPSGASAEATTQLTDLRSIGEQNLDGRMADGYEFYAYDNDKTQGAVPFSSRRTLDCRYAWRWAIPLSVAYR